MEIPGFVGPSNTLASPLADVERTVNLFTERTAPGTGKTATYLRGTPGVRPRLSCLDQPVRGLFYQDGRAFAVAGARFVELFESGLVTNRGTVDEDTLPASFASNGSAGNQVLVISAGKGYIFDLLANTLSAALGADFPADASMCAFMDGYFLVLIKNSRRFQISALEDGTSWDALDVAERSEGSDNIVSMIRNHREIWFLGSQTTEVWYDNGDPLFPFAPIQGVFLETGCAAPFAAVRADNTVVWLDQDERGAGLVRRADGYTPVRISTYAVEKALATASDTNLALAVAFAEVTQGHTFYWLYVPELTTTWVYDSSEGLWHERAIWNATDCVFEPHVAVNHCFAWNVHLVGDRLSDQVYTLSLDYYDDQIVPPA